ncbi:Stage II sporulation protein M [uncultured archaeon]|nr:Stage II sporulation protein M [uncultured archaeon]
MQKDIEYFKSSKNYFLAAVAVFMGSFLAGILISAKYPDAAAYVFSQMKDTYGGIAGLDPLGMMIVIFENNLLISFAALISGLIFGIIPFAVAAFNGVVLGILVEFILKKQGILFVVAAILPHGIIELPMIIISVGIGFRLGHAAYRSLAGMRPIHELFDELTQGVIFYFKIVASLLLMAALIESHITPFIISRFILH